MAPATEPSTLKPDDVLAGRYRLVRLLGEGGMGVVWEARHLATDKPVAIKVLKPRDDASGADGVRFLREAKTAAGLSHRNVVQVFDYWDVEGDPVFLVMELLVGETLGTVLERDGTLSVDRAVALLSPVASAISAAHAVGVVHRDLKPDNVFLARSGTDDHVDVKVLDFGLAKPVTPDAAATAISHTGSLMGTPFYMSPEQVYGEKNIEVASDVWSLGVVVYECLTGTKPFAGENFGQIFRSITQTAPRPLRELVPSVPAALDALVVRMLARDPAGRPGIGEVCAVLASVTGVAAPTATAAPPHQKTQRLSSSPPPHRTQQLPATMLAAATSVHDTSPPTAPARWPRGATVGILAVVLLTGLASAAIALRAKPSSNTNGVVLPPLPRSTEAPNATGGTPVAPIATTTGGEPRDTTPEPTTSGPPPAKALTATDRPKPATSGHPPAPRKADVPAVTPPASATAKSDVPKHDPLGAGRF